MARSVYGQTIENGVITERRARTDGSLSAPFRQAVLDALDSTVPLIGTMTFRSHSWLDTIKQHPRVQAVVLTVGEREAVFQRMLSFVQAVLAQEG